MIFVHRLLILFLSIGACYSYVKVFLDDICKIHTPSSVDSVIINIKGSGPGSAGILRPELIDYYGSNRNCVVTINPPDGYGIVASLKKIDFLVDNCRDSLTIYTDGEEKTFCAFEYYADESKSLWTPGPLKLKYTTGSRIYDWSAAGFELVFTAFKKGSNCGSKEFHCKNDRCIWSGFKCDEHNNCGDLSDEAFGENGGCSTTSVLLRITLSVTSIAVFTMIIIVGIFFCIRMKRKVVTSTTIIEESPNYGSTPKTTYYLPAATTNYQSGPYPPTSAATNYQAGTLYPPVQQGGFVNPAFPEAPPPPYKP